MAIEEDAVSAECYPFKKFKVARLHQDTIKRALTKGDIERVLQFQSSNRYMRFPIDIFAFTYYCGGINFIDIAYLTQANIMEDKLIYKRHKTGKLIKIPLQPQAMELIKKYHSKENPREVQGVHRLQEHGVLQPVCQHRWLQGRAESAEHA